MSKIVKFETAKLAQEKGLKIEFDCDDLIEYGHLSFFGKHHKTEEIIPLNIMFWETHSNSQQFIDLQLYAPSQDDLHEWLRNKHNIIITIEFIKCPSNKFRGKITWLDKDGLFNNEKIFTNNCSKIYEECLENALVEALNFITL